MQRSAKKPPMGSTWRTSHWWLFLLAAADVPLITRNYKLLLLPTWLIRLLQMLRTAKVDSQTCVNIERLSITWEE